MPDCGRDRVRTHIRCPHFFPVCVWDRNDLSLELHHEEELWQVYPLFIGFRGVLARVPDWIDESRIPNTLLLRLVLNHDDAWVKASVQDRFEGCLGLIFAQQLVERPNRRLVKLVRLLEKDWLRQRSWDKETGAIPKEPGNELPNPDD